MCCLSATLDNEVFRQVFNMRPTHRPRVGSLMSDDFDSSRPSLFFVILDCFPNNFFCLVYSERRAKFLIGIFLLKILINTH